MPRGARVSMLTRARHAASLFAAASLFLQRGHVLRCIAIVVHTGENPHMWNRLAAFVAVFWIGAASLLGATSTHTDAASLNAAIAAAAPGDTLYVADGNYSDWTITCATSGAPDKPITIAATTPGGVTLTGADTRFIVTGNHVTISGFRFDAVVRNDNHTIIALQGTDGRVTQCAFKSCGHRVKDKWASWSRIVGISFNSSGIGAANCTVDHNYFYDSKGVSVGIVLGYRDFEPAKWPTNCTIEYNWFYKLPRLGANGGEAIQLCSGGDGTRQFQADGHDTGQFKMFTTIQHNYFYKADADPEIVSLKCSDNTVRYNTFHSNTLGGSGLTIRGGSRNKIVGNFVFNTRTGLRVYGHDHKVINNYFEVHGAGISVNGVTQDGETGESSLFAFNTIKGSHAVILDVPGTSGKPGTAGKGNTWYNNIFQCSGGHKPVDDKYQGDASHVGTWDKNILWNGSAKPAGWQPPGSIWADPQLVLSDGILRPAAGSVAIDAGTDLRNAPAQITDDIDGHARTSATPDIGCDEIYDNIASPPTRKPLKAIDVGPSYLDGTPWGDPTPDPEI